MRPETGVSSAPPPKKFRILFLCTGNSARSILAEYLLKRLDAAHFDAHSAGANPTGKVHPYAIETLRDLYHIDASGARSKSWEEFRGWHFDFVITVCDRARETCPIWPGQPVVAHWGSDDPAAAAGTEEEKRRVFKRVASEISRRLELFCALPLASLDRLRLEEAVRSIGGRVGTPAVPA